MQLKGLMGSASLPPGILSAGSKGIEEGAALFCCIEVDLLTLPTLALHDFDSAKRADRVNEAMPPRRDALEVTSDQTMLLFKRRTSKDMMS